MILDSLLIGLTLFGSVAVRTPNVQPNPDDYEISIGVKQDNYYINRQWERELGTEYIDDNAWVILKHNEFYFKPEYMNKESKNVEYIKVDWRYAWKRWTVGWTTRSADTSFGDFSTFFSVGYKKKKTYGEKFEVEVSFDGYFPPDENGDNTASNFEFEDKFKVSWKATDHVRLYNIGEIYRIRNQEFYKIKWGVEYAF